MLAWTYLTTQGQDLSFSQLSIEQGLSKISVLSIAQDSEGLIWLGTDGGLNRYDGVRFYNYRHDKEDSFSISDNNINSLLNDSKKNLWIGTSKGLNTYNRQKDAFERISVIEKKPVYCIYEDGKGRIWIGTRQGLYLLTDRKSMKFQSFYASGNGLANNIVQTIFEDHTGAIWIGTAKGLTIMREQNGQYRFETFRPQQGQPGNLLSDNITGIAEDAQHRLWIGTLNGGVALYDSATHHFTAYTHRENDPSSLINNTVRRIRLIKNKIWVGTDQGISIINPVTRNITSFQHDGSDKKSLSNDAIYSLFEDLNGSVWVGTYYGGVNIAYSATASFRTYQNNKSPLGLSNNVITGIAEDPQHNLWIGTDGGGLNYLNRSTGRFIAYKNNSNDPSSLGSNLVIAVYIDKEGNVWTGTHGGGLCVLDRKTNRFKRHLYGESDSINPIRRFSSITEDEQGRLWVAGNCPLRVFRKKGLNIEPLELSKEIASLPKNIFASVLFKDAANNIWIGASRGGLYKITDNAAKTIDSSSLVHCIGEDLYGNIWVGLYHGGLERYNNTTDKLIRYGADYGLSNVNIIGLLTDDSGKIWASTNNGLIKFTPGQSRFQLYNVSDGLAGNEFNDNAYFKDSKGEMFFGGFNGITSFFPHHIETNKYTAPLVFTGLKLFNNYVAINDMTRLLKANISLTKELVFKHHQNVFTIEFAVLNFVRPDKNKYSYKLDGVHDQWTETNTPSATFTNLSPGSYTLLVKGANNDGVWSEPSSMKITVLPPFWRTGWAYLLYVLLAATILFFIFRFFYLRALLRRDKELHEVKLNFFTNISHEIRTHLTLVMAPIEKMQKEISHTHVLQRNLNNARNNANRLLKLVTELMDFRKAESNHLKLHIAKHNLVDFLNAIYSSFEELSLEKDIQLSFIYDLNDVPVYFDKEQMEKVVFNLLTNAFKFTPNGGRVCLHMENKNETVQVHVTDNGKGMAPQFVDKIFSNYFQVNDANSQNTGYGIGLALSKTIVELHKGTLTLETHPATADQENMTRFTITLLKGADHFVGKEPLLENTDKEGLTDKEEQVFIFPVITANAEIEEKQYHILITEDNDEVRNLIKDTLHSYKLTECINGAEGLQSSMEYIPDLIISDVMMPEMDGFELCHKLKTDERTSHIPVILLTAKSSRNDQVNGLSTGADVYLTKPFSTQVLDLTVRNLLAAREKMRQKFSKEFVLAPRNAVINTIDEQFLSRLIGIIEESMDSPEFRVELLAKKMAMSQSVLYKKVKALTGMSVNDFHKTIRLKKAAQLLQQKFTVLDVSIMTGFGNREYFSKEFKKHFGKAPSDFIGKDKTEA